MIQDRLRERAADFFIDLDDVSIVRASTFSRVLCQTCTRFSLPHLLVPFPVSLQTHLSFGREYTAAIEAKQVGACHQRSR